MISTKFRKFWNFLSTKFTDLYILKFYKYKIYELVNFEIL